MKQLVELLPVAAFFGVYLLADIYAATIALVVVSAAQIVSFKLLRWPITGQMKLVFWIALISGALTLAFRNPLFIQWKPTIVSWCMAVAIVGSRFIGRGDHIARALGRMMVLPDRAWRALTWGWAGTMAASGCVNLAFAYGTSEPVWVAYKFVSAFAVPTLLAVGSFAYLGATGQMPKLPGDAEDSAEQAPAPENAQTNDTASEADAEALVRRNGQ